MRRKRLHVTLSCHCMAASPCGVASRARGSRTLSSNACWEGRWSTVTNSSSLAGLSSATIKETAALRTLQTVPSPTATEEDGATSSRWRPGCNARSVRTDGKKRVKKPCTRRSSVDCPPWSTRIPDVPVTLPCTTAVPPAAYISGTPGADGASLSKPATAHNASDCR